MREIKFRAWDKNKNRFLKNGEMLLGNIIAWKNNKEFSVGYTSDYEIMQYTGLKDKNGKDIYEGDIMSVNGEIAEVFYDENNVCFCLATDIDYNPCIGRYEIIGNIYENPDLSTSK